MSALKVQFREKGFARETVTAAVVAAAAGPLVLTLSANPSTNDFGFLAALVALPLAAVGASLMRPTPSKMWQRALVGLGWLAAGVVGFFAVGLGLDELTRWNTSTFLAVATGGIGAALGAALGTEGKKHTMAVGAALGFVSGVVGGFALPVMSRYFASEGISPAISASAMTGLLGLWVAAGAGLLRDLWWSAWKNSEKPPKRAAAE